MWQETVRDRTDGGVSKDKQQVDSQADSGFLSGSNLISSELSIDMENEERKDDPKVAPEPAKAIDSGLDLGLTDGLSNLSLKEDVLNVLDSGTIHPDTEELTSEKIENEASQEPWEMYYTQDKEGDTQLHISIIQGFPEAAFFLISLAPHPCLLNIANDEAQTPLHLAVLAHEPRIVRRLILFGADPTVRTFQGNSPLHVACHYGDLNCVQALTNPFTLAERSSLQSGKRLQPLPQNLEQKNYFGETCLHIAVTKGHIEIVRHLLRLGADLEAREGLSGRTSLQLAIEYKLRDVALFIMRECKPKLDATNYGGFTAYHFALDVDKRLAEELIRLGATPSTPPDLNSDDSSDDDEDEDEEDSTDYQMTLARIGINPQNVKPIVI